MSKESDDVIESDGENALLNRSGTVTSGSALAMISERGNDAVSQSAFVGVPGIVAVKPLVAVKAEVACTTAECPSRRAVANSSAVHQFGDARNGAELVKTEVAIPAADLTNSKVRRAVHEETNVGDGVRVRCGVKVGDPVNEDVGVKLPVALKSSVPSAVPLYPNTEDNATPPVTYTRDRAKPEDPEKASDADGPGVVPQTDAANGTVASTPDDADPTSVRRTHEDSDSGDDGEKTSVAVKYAERQRAAVTDRARVPGSHSDFAPMVDA